MSTGAKANPILINGYGSIRTVKEAKQFAEMAKRTNVEGIRAIDASVVLNEALNEAEAIILQFVEKARQYDILVAELQKKANRKGKK